MKLSLLILLSLSWMSVAVYVSPPTHCGEGYYLKTRNYRRRRSRRTSCQPCPTGRHKSFIEHSDSYCDKCESGRYQPERGQADCLGIKCSPGQWGPIGITTATDNVCHTCLEGRYSPNMGQESCQSCPSGLYSAGKGATSCLGSLKCPAGKWGPKFATAPTTCQLCPVGTYGEGSGIFQCPVCPRGKYNLRAGQTECQPFPSCPRWYRVERVAYTCVPIYPLHLYRLLVAVAWITFVVNMAGFCYGERSLGMVPCSPFMGLGVMGIAIWLSVPEPSSFQDGMQDWEYGVLMGLFVTNLLGWVWSYLSLYLPIWQAKQQRQAEQQAERQAEQQAEQQVERPAEQPAERQAEQPAEQQASNSTKAVKVSSMVANV